MVTIQDQKDLANAVLKSVSAIDRNAIIMGGAPRDWHRGVVAKDIDVYVRLPVHSDLEALLRMCIATPRAMSDTVYEDSNIYKVYEFDQYHTPVQVIVLQNSIMNPVRYMDNFPCNMSKCMYTQYLDIVLRDEARKGFEDKMLRFEPGCPQEYIARMLDRFPDWEVDIAYTRKRKEEQARSVSRTFSSLGLFDNPAIPVVSTTFSLHDLVVPRTGD